MAGETRRIAAASGTERPLSTINSRIRDSLIFAGGLPPPFHHALVPAAIIFATVAGFSPTTAAMYSMSRPSLFSSLAFACFALAASIPSRWRSRICSRCNLGDVQ